MKPTPEQRAALETQDRALVVEAGAGTGKTWVLVQRFIHLLEKNPDWPLESILAITFTEKAAREMRTRLRQAIEDRAASHPIELQWQEHRLRLDRMQVSTIHSLCAWILRENAIAAGIDPRFQVLNEQEADLLKEETIRESLQALGQDDHPALALLASLRVYDLRSEMEAMLAKRGTLNRLFSHLEAPDLLLKRWRAGVKRMRSAVWQAQLRETPELDAAIRALPSVEISDPEDLLAGTVQLAQEGCRAIMRGDLTAAADLWLEINLRGGRKDSWGGKEALKVLKADLKLLRESAKTLEKTGALEEIDNRDAAAAEHLQLWQALWCTLEEIYSQIKDERRALDFDDLELLTDVLLHQKPHSPRLAGFLADINHLMVDEFQDTNPVQQRIVYALAPLNQAGKLFAVGDAKQSIYRFRQAQVSIFNQTSAQVRAVTGHPPMRLSTSFRTHASLVRAANALFEKILTPIGSQHEPYEAAPGSLIAHREAHPELTTPVEILLLPSNDPDGEGSLSMEAARIWEADWIGQRLRALKQDQFLVWDKALGSYRPFEYKDAAVLFRATTQVPLYEAAFKELGLPYLTVSGRGYYDQPEVRDLIALLSALANPADDLNLAAVLRSPLFSLSDETLYRLRWHTPDGSCSAEPIAFQEALYKPPVNDQVGHVARARRILSQLWGLRDQVGVWQLLRNALDISAYEVIIAITDGAAGRQLSNLQKFLALAREGNGLTLSAFLRRLRDLQTREAREGEALGKEPESGAVKLMSIHASKGLEFPVVVLADLGRGKRGRIGSPYLLHDPVFGLVCKVRDEMGDWVVPASYAWGRWLNDAMEEAESKRLLYVACTRAADLLILCGKTGRANTWLAEILDAWSITEQGPKEEVSDYEGFAVKVVRPEERPEESQPKEEPALESLIEMVEIPALVLPIPERQERLPVAVTRLVQALSQEGHGRADIRPALWRAERSRRISRAPANLVGNVVHKALAHWDCLDFSDGALYLQLETYAQREGVFRSALEDAVRRSHWILTRLKDNPIYSEISQAARRYHELPFTLEAQGWILHGIIDLLYQDQSGGWHLLDWKTEWEPHVEVEAVSDQDLGQISAYARAVEGMLGTRPKVGLCFLVPEIVYQPFPAGKLERGWKLVVNARDGWNRV